jgi:hypothetical protein
MMKPYLLDHLQEAQSRPTPGAMETPESWNTNLGFLQLSKSSSPRISAPETTHGRRCNDNARAAIGVPYERHDDAGGTAAMSTFHGCQEPRARA